MHTLITTEFAKEYTRSNSRLSRESGFSAASWITMALGFAGFTGDTAGDKVVIRVVNVVVVVSDLRECTVACRFCSFFICTSLCEVLLWETGTQSSGHLRCAALRMRMIFFFNSSSLSWKWPAVGGGAVTTKYNCIRNCT